MSKKGKKPMKKFLTAGVVAVVLCIAMLAGTTLAWFTDVVKSDENYINTGDLNISATYRKPESPNSVAADELTNLYTLNFGKNNEKNLYFPTINKDADKEYKNEYVIDKKSGTTAIFDEMTWEPGKIGARLITVKNEGDLAAQVYLALKDGKTGDIINGSVNWNQSTVDMADVIWFEVLKVNGTKVEEVVTSGRRLKNFNTYAEKITQKVYPAKAAESEGKNTTASFILLYGMDETADNTYKNKTFKATLEIRAIQHAYEEDVFGELYDENATYGEKTSFPEIDWDTSNVTKEINKLIEQLQSIGKLETKEEIEEAQEIVNKAKLALWGAQKYVDTLPEDTQINKLQKQVFQRLVDKGNLAVEELQEKIDEAKANLPSEPSLPGIDWDTDTVREEIGKLIGQLQGIGKIESEEEIAAAQEVVDNANVILAGAQSYVDTLPTDSVGDRIAKASLQLVITGGNTAVENLQKRIDEAKENLPSKPDNGEGQEPSEPGNGEGEEPDEGKDQEPSEPDNGEGEEPDEGEDQEPSVPGMNEIKVIQNLRSLRDQLQGIGTIETEEDIIAAQEMINNAILVLEEAEIISVENNSIFRFFLKAEISNLKTTIENLQRRIDEAKENLPSEPDNGEDQEPLDPDFSVFPGISESFPNTDMFRVLSNLLNLRSQLLLIGAIETEEDIIAAQEMIDNATLVLEEAEATTTTGNSIFKSLVVRQISSLNTTIEDLQRRIDEAKENLSRESDNGITILPLFVR